MRCVLLRSECEPKWYLAGPASLINHSAAPNVVLRGHGRVVNVVKLRSIKENDEVVWRYSRGVPTFPEHVQPCCKVEVSQKLDAPERSVPVPEKKSLQAIVSRKFLAERLAKPLTRLMPGNFGCLSVRASPPKRLIRSG